MVGGAPTIKINLSRPRLIENIRNHLYYPLPSCAIRTASACNGLTRRVNPTKTKTDPSINFCKWQTIFLFKALFWYVKIIPSAWCLSLLSRAVLHLGVGCCLLKKKKVDFRPTFNDTGSTPKTCSSHFFFCTQSLIVIEIIISGRKQNVWKEGRRVSATGV